jgi:hypothetical protein
VPARTAGPELGGDFPDAYRGRSELAPDGTVGVSAEVVLGSLEFALGSLPLVARGQPGAFWAEGAAGVGDGVIEAIGLDALGCLLPGALHARLIGRRAECGQQVWARMTQRAAHVVAAVGRQPGIELGGALEQPAAFGVPCRAVGDLERQLALALCRRGCLLFGEVETLVLECYSCGVGALPAK